MQSLTHENRWRRICRIAAWNQPGNSVNFRRVPVQQSRRSVFQFMKPNRNAPGFFGSVHRPISPLEHVFLSGLVVDKQGYANACCAVMHNGRTHSTHSGSKYLLQSLWVLPDRQPTPLEPNLPVNRSIASR